MDTRSSSKVLQIFMKAPEPGKVKTRLIPDLGVAQATRIHIKLVKQVLAIAEASQVDEVQCWVSGDLNHPFVTGLDDHLKVIEQRGANLGDRMLVALTQGLRAFDKVVLVGADAYSLTPGYIEQAFIALDGKGIVLGPALDGGYILIGAADTNPHMFNQVSWGQETVLKQQITALESIDLSYELLEERWDIDTIDDIHRHAPELLS